MNYQPTKFPFVALRAARDVVAKSGFLELFQNIVPKGEWYRGKFPADDCSVGTTIRFGDATFSSEYDENNVVEQIEQVGRNYQLIRCCGSRADFVFAVILFCQCAETVGDYILDADQYLLPEKCPTCCEYLDLKPFGECGSNCECELNALATAEAEYDDAEFEAKRHEHVIGLEFPACKCFTCFIANVHETTNVAPKPHPYLE